MNRYLLLLNLAVGVTVLVGLAALYRKENKNMSALTDAIDNVRDAQIAEAQRVESIITILKSNPSADETAAAIAELEGVKAALDNQEPTPAAPAA